jgi:hypothetical protein
LGDSKQGSPSQAKWAKLLPYIGLKPFPLILMYLPIDYNCFVNQLYHKMKIICKKRVTCKKKQGDFNFAL